MSNGNKEVGGDYVHGHTLDQSGAGNKGTIIQNNDSVTVHLTAGSAGESEGGDVTITNDVSGNQVFNFNLQNPRAEEVLKIIDGLIDRGLVNRDDGVKINSTDLPKIESQTLTDESP